MSTQLPLFPNLEVFCPKCGESLESGGHLELAEDSAHNIPITPDARIDYDNSHHYGDAFSLYCPPCHHFSELSSAASNALTW